MNNSVKGILPKGFLIDEKYRVVLFIKQGKNAETYRVKGDNGKLYFLKLFNYAKLHRSAFDSENNLLEIEFLKLIKQKSLELKFDEKILSRQLNVGFSGGEKKRKEIFQMAMLEPKLAILDETDSGLDIDALRIVANGVNKLKSKDNAVIVITHYQRLLDYIVPDFVHVLHNGKIVKSGTKELAHELEAKGYDWIKEEVDA